MWGYHYFYINSYHHIIYFSPGRNLKRLFLPYSNEAILWIMSGCIYHLLITATLSKRFFMKNNEIKSRDTLQKYWIHFSLISWPYVHTQGFGVSLLMKLCFPCPPWKEY